MKPDLAEIEKVLTEALAVLESGYLKDKEKIRQNNKLIVVEGNKYLKLVNRIQKLLDDLN